MARNDIYGFTVHRNDPKLPVMFDGNSRKFTVEGMEENVADRSLETSTKMGSF